jgi:hypothetical protein
MIEIILFRNNKNHFKHLFYLLYVEAKVKGKYLSQKYTHQQSITRRDGQTPQTIIIV